MTDKHLNVIMIGLAGILALSFFSGIKVGARKPEAPAVSEDQRRREEAIRIQEQRLIDQIELEEDWRRDTGGWETAEEKMARIRARDEAGRKAAAASSP